MQVMSLFSSGHQETIRQMLTNPMERSLKFEQAYFIPVATGNGATSMERKAE